MKNDAMRDEIFEVVLKNAFADAFRRELAEYERESEAYRDLQPTAAQKKAARRAYKKALGKKAGAAAVFRRAAAAALILIVVGGAVLLAAPTVRASIRDAFVKLFDHYVSISFSDEEPLRLGEHQLAYLPKGYALSYSREGRLSSTYRFSDGENELSLVITRSPYSSIMIDNEHHTFEPVEIGGMSGYKAIPTDASRDVMLVWGDETWSYMLDGKVPIETLVRMAKSLAKAAPDVAGE